MNTDKILFLVGEVGRRSGGEKSNQTLFHFLKPDFDNMEFIAQADLPAWIQVFNERMNLIFFLLSNIYFAAKLRKAKLLVIDFYMHPHLLLSRLLKPAKQKWLGIIREAYHLEKPKNMRTTKMLQSFVFPAVDVLTVNCNAVGADYRSKVKNFPNPRLIYSGFDFPKEIMPPRELSQNSEMRILHVGFIRHKKGVHSLIKALEYLETDNFSLTLAGDYAGDPEFKGQCDKIIQDAGWEEGKVTFTGHVSMEEVKQLYQNSDVFVFASLFEPIGQVLFEATSQAIPIACSNTGAVPEVVPEDCALFFDPEKPEEIGEKLNMFLNNPELMKHYSGQTLKILEHATTRQEMADEYRKIFKELLK